MKDTVPIFILSSGRSGTQMVERLLSSLKEVEMHHEYLCEYVQPLAVKYYTKLADITAVVSELKKLHGASIHYTQKKYWGDSSNKLSWLIPGLNILFPKAKFVHLIRDGRKVVSSYYNKLGKECYDNESTAILQSWIDNPLENQEPPPEKKYWWNIITSESSFYDEFQGYNQFQRICFHWKEINQTIDRELLEIDKSRKITIRLEDIVLNESFLEQLILFLGIDYQTDLFAMLKKPHNVNVPRDYPLTNDQRKQFYKITGEVMTKYGYNEENEYRVKYNGKNSIRYGNLKNE